MCAKLKQTEIGRIPEGWKDQKLDDIGSFKYGYTATSIQENTGVRYLRITDIAEDGSINWEDMPYCKITKEELEKYKINEGDILFARIGATAGKTCFIKHPKNAAFASYLIRFQVREGTDSKFVYYFTQSNLYWSQALRLREGQLKKGLNANTLAEIRIAVPSETEQEQISDILSTLDDAIQKADSAIETTERLKRGLMQRFLTKGLVLGFMLDTTVFNDILDKKIDITKFPKNFKFLVTHIQYDQLSEAKNEVRRKELLNLFTLVDKKEIPTESAVYDISKYDKAKFGDGKILENLRKDNLNDTEDALIGETAIKNNLVLVTNDKGFLKRVKEVGGSAITLEDSLNGNYRVFKDSELGQIPKEWDVVTLGDERIAEIRGNKTINTFERIAFIPMEFVPTSDIFIKYEVRPMNEIRCFTYCERGDLLLAKITPSLENGKQGIVPDNVPNGFALATTEVFPIACKTIDNLFLFYLLKSPKFRNRIISSMIGTTGRQRASKESVENLSIPLPPLPEQKKIVEILGAVDEKLGFERRRKEKLERVKKGLMDDLLTGRKRVAI